MTTSSLSIGKAAPDFTLPPTPDQKVSLSEFRAAGDPVAFYPVDWSPVGGDQMALLVRTRDRLGAHVDQRSESSPSCK